MALGLATSACGDAGTFAFDESTTSAATSAAAVPTTKPSNLVVTSSAAPTARPTPTSVPSTAQPTPTISVPAPTFARPPAPKSPPSAKGYTYGGPAKPIREAFDSQKVPEVLSEPLVRSVLKSGKPIGTAAFWQFHGEGAGDATLEKNLISSLTKGLEGQGFVVKTRTENGHPVVTGTKKVATILVWYRDGVLGEFVSTQPLESGLGYVRAVLA